MEGSGNGWNIAESKAAERTLNPIRQIVDGTTLQTFSDKKPISLSIGDPTLFDNLKTHASIVESVKKNLDSYKYNGYAPAHGFESARTAVAKRFSYGKNITKNDVFITSGASGALEIVLNAILDTNTYILLPKPGFSLYTTLAQSKNIQIKQYDLIPDKEWEADLEQIEQLVKENPNCGALLINNPSNPCGSNFSKEHLLKILELAKKLKIPIISDEIYFDMTFNGQKFYSLIELNDAGVPLFVVSGLAKRYLVPGWRVGWIIYYDPNKIAPSINDALGRTCQIIIGANTVIQASIEDILLNTPSEFYQQTLAVLEENANLTVEMISKIKGLKCIVPQGAMYTMVGIDTELFKDLSNDVEFMQKLYEEQAVMCLPGKCFGYENYIRIVISSPKSVLAEAYQRICEFCKAHYKS